MALLGRIVMVFVGYGLACIAAALVFTIGTLTPAWDDLASLGLPSAALWPIVGVAAVFIWGMALLPALLVIVLAEGFALRSSVLYAVLGGALALALCFGLDFAGYIAAPELAREREVLGAAGIAGGLVYWLFAGRNAGLVK
jgi:hypothetical protein